MGRDMYFMIGVGSRIILYAKTIFVNEFTICLPNSYSIFYSSVFIRSGFTIGSIRYASFNSSLRPEITRRDSCSDAEK